MSSEIERLNECLKIARFRADYFERETERLQAEIVRLEHELRIARAEATNERLGPCEPRPILPAIQALADAGAASAFADVDADAYVRDLRGDEDEDEDWDEGLPFRPLRAADDDERMFVEDAAPPKDDRTVKR